MIAGILSLLWVIIYTPKGGEFAVVKAAEYAIDSQEMTVASSRGSLRRGLVLTDLVLEFEAKSDAVIKIQELTLRIDDVSKEGIVAEIHNGRIIIPNADPVVFFGKIINGNIDIDGSTKSLNRRVLTENFPMNLTSDIYFDVANVDFRIDGTLSFLKIKASFDLKNGLYKKFKAKGARVRIEGDIEKKVNDWKPSGDIVVVGGEVKGEKTATVNIVKGVIGFNKLWLEPDLDIRGKSEVDKVKISINVTGNFKKPNIILTSEPSVPKEKLLLMLATNRGWEATAEAIKAGQVVSADVAKEFINYFLFSGGRSDLMKKLGIREIDVRIEKGKRGVSVIKDVTESLRASYGVTQITNEEVREGGTIKQQIGGEYIFNENISAEFKKDIYSTQDGTGEPVQPADDSILLKFRKSF